MKRRNNNLTKGIVLCIGVISFVLYMLWVVSKQPHPITNDNKTFLSNNLIAELMTEFPEIESLISELDRQMGKVLEWSEFKAIINSKGYSGDKLEKLLKVLFDVGYICGYDKKLNESYQGYDNFKDKLQKKLFFVFPMKAYIIPCAKAYFLRITK